MRKKCNIVISVLLMVSIIQIPLFACSDNIHDIRRIEKHKIVMLKNIVDVTRGDGRFDTLVTALKATGMDDSLKGQGPFTVFAPTDDAFSKLPKGAIDALLKPENKDALTSILNNHVIRDKLIAENVTKLEGKELIMASGDKAKIEVKDGSLYIEGAKVTVTDIMAKNGVIHVIDTVMMPPTDKVK